MDVFAKPELFASYRDKLLDSIFITVADAPTTLCGRRAPDPGAIRGFIQTADAAPANEVARTRKAAHVEKRGRAS